MRTWHPESWSVQARRLANKYLKWEDREDARKSLCNCYYEGLIRQRAAKRFGKISRKEAKKGA